MNRTWEGVGTGMERKRLQMEVLEGVVRLSGWGSGDKLLGGECEQQDPEPGSRVARTLELRSLSEN